MAKPAALDYDYSTAGFDDFFGRSIGGSGSSSQAPVANRSINFDQQQIGGSFGDKLKIGNIVIDGAGGIISVYDEAAREVIRIGKVSG